MVSRVRGRQAGGGSHWPPRGALYTWFSRVRGRQAGGGSHWFLMSGGDKREGGSHWPLRALYRGFSCQGKMSGRG